MQHLDELAGALSVPDEGSLVDTPREADAGDDTVAATQPPAVVQRAVVGFSNQDSDSRERDTTPGFQQDKWERGTLMPR